MTVNQVYAFIQEAAKQTTGLTAVTNLDASGLVSLGDEVLSSNTNLENFTNSIFDVLGRSIVSTRPYSPRVKSLMLDGFTFGAYLRKIYVDPMKAQKSPQWDIDDNDGAGVDLTTVFVIKPTVKTKIFEGIDTWEFDTAIPDIQWRSAFRSAEEMIVLIDAVYTALSNSMSMALEAMANTVYGTMIANRLIETKAKSNPANVVVDLLSLYKEASGDTTMTAAKAKTSADFYKFAGETIRNYIKYMGTMNTTFNTEGYYRFTPEDKLRFTVVSDFANAFDTYLQSDTFHNEITALPNYVEIPYWQGIGTATTDTRKINITTQDYTVAQDGIVAVLSDMDALGMTINNQRRKSAYDPRHELTAIYDKADKGYFADPSENCVVFILADSIATPTQSQSL